MLNYYTIDIKKLIEERCNRFEIKNSEELYTYIINFIKIYDVYDSLLIDSLRTITGKTPLIQKKDLEDINTNIKINDNLIKEIINEVINEAPLNNNEIQSSKQRVSWININGKEIFQLDFRNLASSRIQKLMIIFNTAIEETNRRLKTTKIPKNDVLFLNLMENSAFTMSTQDAAKRFTQKHMNKWVKTDNGNSDGKSIGSVGVGFVGIKGIIIKAVNPDMKQFNTIPEAIDYLINL